MDDWQKMDAEKTARILTEVNPHLTPVSFDDQQTAIRSQKMAFYKEYVLLEMTDLSVVPAARKYVVYKPGDVNVLTWINQPIYDLNEKAPILLNEKTVQEYVRFFFTYVRGRHGRFSVIEKIDDIRWQTEPPLQGRKVIQEMLMPIALVGRDDDGTFNLECFMVFKDSLFKTKVHVKVDGLVSMSDEELKIEGMPVLNDAAA